jgi:hypothetical protein
VKFLLYCVFGSREGQETPRPQGVCGQPVFTVASNGLCAAMSRICPSNILPNIGRALAYGRVIESFHREFTVVPMRYGCVFEEQSQVLRMLEERAGEYRAMLKELEGCVEMGICVLWEDGRGSVVEEESSVSESVFEKGDAANGGRAYLAERKAYYAPWERFVRRKDALLERCRAAFAGLFVRCKAEISPWRVKGSPLGIGVPSFYFMIRRGSVEAFKEAFREFSSREKDKFLLSGPWPPYNFVGPTARPMVGLFGNEIQNQ